MPQRRHVPVPLVAGVIGVLIGALGVGLPWLLSGGGGGGSSTASLSAPSTLGSLLSYQNASARFGSRALANARQHADDDGQSTRLLSAAYGGAAALVAQYSDNELNSMASLLIVRADSPQPFALYENLKETGLAAPVNEVERFGAVSCLVQNVAIGSSATEPAQDVYASYCQRSGPGLTVQVRPSGDISHHPDQIAALVDDAWFAVH